MAVFVFGIVIGNKDRFGFQMEPGEQQRLGISSSRPPSSCACSSSSCSARRSISR
jgi:hypothetical protein